MSGSECLFCRIVEGEVPSHVVWQDDAHIAVLTPFPNTTGFTVVLTREHLPSYVCDLSDDAYAGLWNAGRAVARLIDRGLGTKRCGLVAEGFGIDHAHVKVIPMHGIPDGAWHPILSGRPNFLDKYEGFITSADGPRMDDVALSHIAMRIRGAGKSVP